MNPLNLQPNEAILRRERLHAGIFAFPILLFFLLLIPEGIFFSLLWMMGRALNNSSPSVLLFVFLFLFSLLPVLVVLGIVWLSYAHSEITLTNRRLLYRTGFIARASGELPLANVEGIVIFEPLLGRLFGFGTVGVTSVGGVQYPMRFIGKPHIFHGLLQKAVAQAKAGTTGVPPVCPAPPAAAGGNPFASNERYMPKG